MKDQIQADTGIRPPFALEAFPTLTRTSASRSLASRPPLDPQDHAVRGFVYEVETGKLREVR